MGSQVEGRPVDDRRHAPQAGPLVDQVEGPDLVVGPQRPVADRSAMSVNVRGRRRHRHGHAPVVADPGNSSDDRAIEPTDSEARLRPPVRLGDSIAKLEGLETVERNRQRDGRTWAGDGRTRAVSGRPDMQSPHSYRVWRRTLVSGWMVAMLAVLGSSSRPGRWPRAGRRRHAGPRHRIGPGPLRRRPPRRVNAERAARSARAARPALTMVAGSTPPPGLGRLHRLDRRRAGPLAARLRGQPVADADVRDAPTPVRPATGTGPVTARRDGGGLHGLGRPPPEHAQRRYQSVGIGVTCSGGQAFTVELFGYAYGNLGLARASRPRRTRRGDPVPAGPTVAASRPVCPSTARPGRRPDGATTATAGSTRTLPVPPVPGSRCRPRRPSSLRRHGVSAATPATGGEGRRHRGDPRTRRLRLDGRQAPRRAHHPHRGHPDGRGYWLVGADAGSSASVTPPSTAPWRLPLAAPSWT